MKSSPLNAPDEYILAIVQITSEYTNAPRYVRGALDVNEPDFLTTTIQKNLKGLLEQAEAPS